jgi:hypothetical protein
LLLFVNKTEPEFIWSEVESEPIRQALQRFHGYGRRPAALISTPDGQAQYSRAQENQGGGFRTGRLRFDWRADIWRIIRMDPVGGDGHRGDPAEGKRQDHQEGDQNFPSDVSHRKFPFTVISFLFKRILEQGTCQRIRNCGAVKPSI